MANFWRLVKLGRVFIISVLYMGKADAGQQAQVQNGVQVSSCVCFSVVDFEVVASSLHSSAQVHGTQDSVSM